MTVAVVTMVYNERVNLPIWLGHYRAHCPGAALFIIDHGSDDGSVEGLRDVTVIPVARSALDERDRAALVADVQRALLRTHETVVFTDCDEMLVADPARHASLASFLAAVPDAVIAPAGVHVLHEVEAEPALDPGRPIMAQRGWVEFGSGMCKPMIARVPLRWDVGFHGADRRPCYRGNLIHFHLGFADRTIALERLAVTRTMAWSEASLAAGHGFHQRLSDEAYLNRSFLRPSRLIRGGAARPFEFGEELARLEGSLRERNGYWMPDPPFWGRVAAVPERFRSVF